MLKYRTTLLCKGLLVAVMAGVGLWTTGCSHDQDDDARHAQHSGWHERGSYDNGYNTGYDRGSGYDHNYQ